MLAYASLLCESRAEQIMSMPALQKRQWSAAEVRRLIDEHPEPTPRIELVHGELLVSPSPGKKHQRIVFELAVLLSQHVKEHRLGEVLISPADLDLAPGLIVQPDVYVIPSIGGRRPRAQDPTTRIILSVEVVSPGTARYDRVDKRYGYQEVGVSEYCIVDADARTFERWRPTDSRPEVLDRELVWHPDEAIGAFTLDIPAFFAAQSDDYDT